MDLRYYQSLESLVPYRYCRPFRSESLAIIGIIIKNPAYDVENKKINGDQNNKNSGIRGEVSSRLVE